MQDVAAPLIGVDVAKAELVIAGMPGRQAVLTISNGKRAIAAWLKSLPAGSSIAMESTGSYHQLLAQLARQAGMRVYIINPKHIWHASRAEGRRGKTDRIDAEVIRKYLRDNLERLHIWSPGTSIQIEIESLLRRHQTLEKHATAIRLSMAGIKGLRLEMNALLQQFDAMQHAIDLRIDLLVGMDQAMVAGRALLETIVGIGPKISPALTCLFSRVPFQKSDSVVAFVGLDPRAKDSGTKHGGRHITKQGPAYIRKQLWLCGFAASHSKLFKPAYTAMLQRGIPTTAALMILGRHILRIAWAVWRSGKPFDPSLVGRSA